MDVKVFDSWEEMAKAFPEFAKLRDDPNILRFEAAPALCPRCQQAMDRGRCHTCGFCVGCGG